jgi:hypothetical protein
MHCTYSAILAGQRQQYIIRNGTCTVHHASDVYRSCISTLTYVANTSCCSARVELTIVSVTFDFGEVDAESDFIAQSDLFGP